MLRSTKLFKVAAVLAAAGVLSALLTSAGCSKKKDDRTVRVIGSTSIQPFAELLADEFNASQNEVYVEVQGGGSTTGLQSVENRRADIGMCSRALKSGEDFKFIVIAYDGIAIIVNNANPVTGLSRQQAADIFAGKFKYWTDDGIGGPKDSIRLITREEGSGTREAFTSMVMQYGFNKQLSKLQGPYKNPATMPSDLRKKVEQFEEERPAITMYSITEPSNGSVKALVEGDSGAIGYMSLGQVGREVKAIKIDGVMPSSQTVLETDPAKKYPLVRPFLFVYQGEMSPGAKKFVDFVLSEEAQDILQKKGLVRVDNHGQE